MQTWGQGHVHSLVHHGIESTDDRFHGSETISGRQYTNVTGVDTQRGCFRFVFNKLRAYRDTTACGTQQRRCEREQRERLAASYYT